MGEAIDSLIALAGVVQVKSYKRTSKSGKVVDVQAHTRSPGDMSTEEIQDELKALNGKIDSKTLNRRQQLTNELRGRSGSSKVNPGDLVRVQSGKTYRVEAVDGSTITMQDGSKHPLHTITNNAKQTKFAKTQREVEKSSGAPSTQDKPNIDAIMKRLGEKEDKEQEELKALREKPKAPYKPQPAPAKPDVDAIMKGLDAKHDREAAELKAIQDRKSKVSNLRAKMLEGGDEAEKKEIERHKKLKAKEIAAQKATITNPDPKKNPSVEEQFSKHTDTVLDAMSKDANLRAIDRQRAKEELEKRKAVQTKKAPVSDPDVVSAVSKSKKGMNATDLAYELRISLESAKRRLQQQLDAGKFEKKGNYYVPVAKPAKEDDAPDYAQIRKDALAKMEKSGGYSKAEGLKIIKAMPAEEKSKIIDAMLEGRKARTDEEHYEAESKVRDLILPGADFSNTEAGRRNRNIIQWFTHDLAQTKEYEAADNKIRRPWMSLSAPSAVEALWEKRDGVSN